MKIEELEKILNDELANFALVQAGDALVIYNLKTGTVKMIEPDELSTIVKKAMLEAGIPVLDDFPEDR